MSKEGSSNENIETNISKDLVTVVLCTLNEEEGIGKVLDDLKANGYKNILVIDGYSTDATVKIARERGARVIYQHWSGKAGAVKTALDYVDTPYVAFLDADATYPPKELDKLILHVPKYVEVIGKRSKENIPLLHRFGNTLINKLFALIFSVDVGDVLSGMYVLHTNLAKTLNLNSKGFEIEIEIVSQMVQRGKVTYVDIRYENRRGKRKLSSFKDGMKIVSYLIKMAKDYNPILFFSIIASIFLFPGLITLGYTFIDYLLHGIFHSGYALMGTALTLVGVQGFLTAGTATILKRIEYHILHNNNSRVQ
ncbi:glycosyltransferase family 2 protein [Saccharolobus islandicus]|uniref:glycosyltransferase family 2 protein n=1 Tax=Saccharolobus islandicus TaxID=43080 RepID=UPI00037FC0FF|nr:glycosyltransferase family 2 protein [Sulfolobus islandicus]